MTAVDLPMFAVCYRDQWCTPPFDEGWLAAVKEMDGLDICPQAVFGTREEAQAFAEASAKGLGHIVALYRIVELKAVAVYEA